VRKVKQNVNTFYIFGIKLSKDGPELIIKCIDSNIEKSCLNKYKK